MTYEKKEFEKIAEKKWRIQRVEKIIVSSDETLENVTELVWVYFCIPCNGRNTELYPVISHTACPNIIQINISKFVVT